MRQRGFPRPRRPPEDERAGTRGAGGIAARGQLPQRRPLAKQVLLAHHVIEGPRPHPDRQRAARRGGHARCPGGGGGSVVVAVVAVGSAAKEIIHIDRLLLVSMDNVQAEDPPMAVNDGSATRVAFVSGGRLHGWVERFSAGHGTPLMTDVDGGLQLSAPDGAVALLHRPGPSTAGPDAAATSWRGWFPSPGSRAASACSWSGAAGMPWRSSARGKSWRPRPAPAGCRGARRQAGHPSSALRGAAPTRLMPSWSPLRSMPAGSSPDSGLNMWRPGVTGPSLNSCSPNLP